MDAALDDIAALRSALEKAQVRAAAAEAEAARAVAQVSSTAALIASLRLEIEKLRREIYGQRSSVRLAVRADGVPARGTESPPARMNWRPNMQRRGPWRSDRSPARGRRAPFPAHLPRERIVIPAPSACACCGSTKLAKLGETITETLKAFRASGRLSRRCGRTPPPDREKHPPTWAAVP